MILSINTNYTKTTPFEERIRLIKNAGFKSVIMFWNGSDVFEQEPLPSDSPLWSLENLVITPHTAGGFHLPDTKDKIIAIAAQNIRAVLGKAEYRNIIDFSTGYKK